MTDNIEIMESPPGATAVINGRRVDYFGGCGYFGLQGDPEVIQAACQAVGRYGMGVATSRRGCGSNPAIIEAEHNAARFFATEDALYFASGYLGNMILLQGLTEDYDIIFADSQAHYSVHDGARITGKPIITFAHRDPGNLRAALNEHVSRGQRPLVICDGVSPVSGQIAPVVEYFEILEGFGRFVLCVDDAHAVGVIGEQGRGTFEYLGMSDPRLYSWGTMSKAFGAYGGIIAGDRTLKDKLATRSPVISGSTPPPTPIAAATARALEILHDRPQLRRTLWDNVQYAKDGLRALGFEIDRTPVPIICLTGKPAALATLPEKLLSRGIVVSRWYEGQEAYASVPEGGCIRIAIFSTHSRQQIDRLLGEIKTLV